MRARHVATLLLTTLGTLVLLPAIGTLAFLAWPIGIALLWSTTVWTAKEKLLATAVWPTGVALPLIIGVFAARTCLTTVSSPIGELAATSENMTAVTSTVCTGFALPSAVGIPLFTLMIVAPIAVAAILLWRAHQRQGSKQLQR